MLKGKWCLVTGANRGIGKAIALAFAKEGASLLLVARNTDALKAVAVKCQAAGAAAAEIYSTELSDSRAIDSLAADVLKKHERVDVLVNCAGLAHPDGQSAVTGDPDGYNKVRKAGLLVPRMRFAHVEAQVHFLWWKNARRRRLRQCRDCQCSQLIAICSLVDNGW